MFFIPIKINKNENINFKNKIVSLDPGIRTFTTGLSDNNIFKIGPNVKNKIKPILLKIDKTNSLKCKNKIKEKILIRCNKKIKNYIDDLHWKSIKYLTDNYETILIGDLSAKKICNNKFSNINAITKRIAYALSFYKFRERLKYKCELNNNTNIVVNEKYTSKMCSCCGNYKENVNSNKIYNCLNCKSLIDRDINGSRNILLKII